MRARTVAIICGLVGALSLAACKKAAPPDEQGARKPRVDLTLWIDPPSPTPQDVSVTTATPPKDRQMFERDGVHVAVVGVPSEGDPEPFLQGSVFEAAKAGSNATVLVTTRCLKDLKPALERNILAFWSVAVVIGARCDGGVTPTLGAMALVEAGGATRVKITFDRHTRAFLKVEPIP